MSISGSRAGTAVRAVGSDDIVWTRCECGGKAIRLRLRHPATASGHGRCRARLWTRDSAKRLGQETRRMDRRLGSHNGSVTAAPPGPADGRHLVALRERRDVRRRPHHRNRAQPAAPSRRTPPRRLAVTGGAMTQSGRRLELSRRLGRGEGKSRRRIRTTRAGSV